MSFLTDKGAATKWCPMVRDSCESLRGSYNRADGENPVREFNRCLGSGCAMWRTVDEVRCRHIIHTENRTATEEPERPGNVPASWQWFPFDEGDGDPPGWAEPVEEARQRVRGYCGLAPLHVVKDPA